MFQELGADSSEILSKSLYFPAGPDEERAICRRTIGALAFTSVRSSVTRLCLKFSSLRVHEAARLILHEALHHAGMSEAPHTEGALNSHQINLLVSKNCGL